MVGGGGDLAATTVALLPVVVYRRHFGNRSSNTLTVRNEYALLRL
jgi:hypothetical protein